MKNSLLNLFLVLFATASVLPAGAPVTTRVKLRKDGIGRRWLLPGIAYGGLTAAGVSGVVWAYCHHQLSATREELARLNSMPPEVLKNMNFYERSMYSYRKFELENKIQSLRKAARAAKKLGIGLTAIGALGFLGKKLDTKFGCFGNSDAGKKVVLEQQFRIKIHKIERAAGAGQGAQVLNLPESDRVLPAVGGVVVERGGGGDCAIHSMYQGLPPEHKKALNLTAQVYQEQVDQIRKRIVDEVVARVRNELDPGDEQIRQRATQLVRNECKSDEHIGKQKAAGLMRSFMQYLTIPCARVQEYLPAGTVPAENHADFDRDLRHAALQNMNYDQLEPLFKDCLQQGTPAQLSRINEYLTEGSLFIQLCEQLYGRKTEAKLTEMRAALFTERNGRSPANKETSCQQFEADIATITLKDIEDKYQLIKKYKSTMHPQTGGNAWLDILEIRVAAEQVFKRPICIWRAAVNGYVLVEIANGQALNSLKDAIHLYHNSASSRKQGKSIRGNHYQSFVLDRFLPAAQP